MFDVLLTADAGTITSIFVLVVVFRPLLQEFTVGDVGVFLFKLLQLLDQRFVVRRICWNILEVQYRNLFFALKTDIIDYP